MQTVHQPDTIINDLALRADDTWLRYFSKRAAKGAFFAHIATRPSYRTPEQHTLHIYRSGLEHFEQWSLDTLPTESLVESYMAALAHAGLKSTTINSKYLAPVRLYIKKLVSQRIDAPRTAPERDFIADCREHMRAALMVKGPPADTTTNIAPLWRADFNRLNLNQVNMVLRGIDTSTLIGLRNYALLHVMFTTGLRLAEAHRITPNTISRADTYLITVRGKRSNFDPVPLDEHAHRSLLAWIDAYNDALPLDDPRRITGDIPVWQPIAHNRHRPLVEDDPRPLEEIYPAISHQAMRDMIASVTERTVGIRLAAHDTRRTTAAVAYELGMPLREISALLRHSNIAVTDRYIGQRPDFGARMLANYGWIG